MRGEQVDAALLLRDDDEARRHGAGGGHGGIRFDVQARVRALLRSQLISFDSATSINFPIQ